MLIFLPAGLEVQISRVQHGVGASHQAAKATAAKVIQRFYWPGLKRDVKLRRGWVANLVKKKKLSRHGYCRRWRIFPANAAR